MYKILITGASGFIGRRLINSLEEVQAVLVRASVRQINTFFPFDVDQVITGNLLPNTDWSEALESIDVVIHLAARVHIMNDENSDPSAEFHKTNTLGTLNLARQAAELKVGRFIYLSSIKVNGETTTANELFNEQVNVAPIDPYGLSKYLAEQGLKEVANKTTMDVVIIRPPLVYGPNVKANFETMMKWLYRGMPLPLGAVHNQRSLVALDNIIDLIKTCIVHPNAVNQTFLVSDDEDLSTTELLQRLSTALGKPSRLIPVSSSLLIFTASLLGKQDMIRRLCGSLQVDISHTKNTLDWKPPCSVDEALQETANAFLEQLS